MRQILDFFGSHDKPSDSIEPHATTWNNTHGLIIAFSFTFRTLPGIGCWLAAIKIYSLRSELFAFPGANG